MEDADAFLWSVWNLERGRGRWLVTRLLVRPFLLKRFRREQSTSLTVRASNVARIGQLRAQMLPELRATLNLPGQAHAKRPPHTYRDSCSQFPEAGLADEWPAGRTAPTHQRPV